MSGNGGPRKVLLLLRHAKSDWSHDVVDHERPLAPRGRRATGTVGRFLAATNRRPDGALSSTAVRARRTAERVLEAAGLEDLPIRLERDLYESSAERVIDVVQTTPDEVSRLLLVGHEPTWSALAGTLIGGGDLRFPTAALAAVRFPATTWAGIGPGRGELLFLVTPKLLEKPGKSGKGEGLL